MQDNDVSVNWHGKEMSTDMNLINEYVDDFLNCNELDLKIPYKDLLRYSIKTGFTYKVHTFEELYKIYTKIKNIKGIGAKSINLSWIDMSEIVTIITYSNEEIPYTDKESTCEFIRINIPEQNNSVILSKNLFAHFHMPWVNYSGDDYDQIKKQSDYSSFNGYELTQLIKKIVAENPKNANEINAFTALKSLVQDKVLNQNYEAYIPSIAELKFIYKHADLINHILLKIMNEKELKTDDLLNIKAHPFIMSSSLSSVSTSYEVLALTYSISTSYPSREKEISIEVEYPSITSLLVMLPLFKKIK